jgi:hypothetical protein
METQHIIEKAKTQKLYIFQTKLRFRKVNVALYFHCWMRILIFAHHPNDALPISDGKGFVFVPFLSVRLSSVTRGCISFVTSSLNSSEGKTKLILRVLIYSLIAFHYLFVVIG